eukprot:7765592-Pyramimonas_sp.AAC.1
MTGVSRVFGKINRAEAASWGRDHCRNYQHGAQGRSCVQAVWEQSLSVEYVNLQGGTTGTSLMGLTKAYHKVCHYLLITAAVKWNIP